MTECTKCYGTMFPDLGCVEFDKPMDGQAFELLVESHGIGVSSRHVKVRPDGWDRCMACENCRDCYDLSMAKPTRATVLETRT